MLDLSSLNSKQAEAVTAPLGPTLVLAGAGSGKTRVLAFRIAYLIEQKLIPAGNILALTFTNKAAKEMQGRVQVLLGRYMPARSQYALQVGGTMPTMGTFHSVGARLLRREIRHLGYTESFTIYDADDALKVIKEICTDLSISAKFSPSLFRSFISSAKNLVQTPADFNIGLESFLHGMASQVYAQYQNFLHRQNALDFDDLLLLPIKLFQARSDVLKKYQEFFQYILVDEYQDTNQAQYELLKLLVKKEVRNEDRELSSQLTPHSSLLNSISENLFVVGDDAQSIYGFRGSDIRNILNFEKDFPQSTVITLDQNYRSTGNILKAAQQIIELNPEQKSKVLWTENGDGQQVVIEQLQDEQAEAEFVAKTIVRAAGDDDVETESIEYEPEDKPFSILDQFLKKNNMRSAYLPKLPSVHKPLSEFAVLYRTHAQSRSLEEVFMAAGIPYHIVGGVKFYERKEIKDVLAYARLLLNPGDLVSLKRVLNVPTRGVGEKSYELVRKAIMLLQERGDTPVLDVAAIIESMETVPLATKAKKAVHGFFELIASLQEVRSDATLTDVVKTVLKKISFEQYVKDGTETGEARWENVKELLTVATQYDSVPWQEGLQGFLEEVALFTEIDTVEDEKDAVTFMTLHSAKGLEFDTVFFIGLEEGVLPHSRSLLDPGELAEEIRLAYVGVTRARKKLYLTHARMRTIFGSRQNGVPSRILQALGHGRRHSTTGAAPTSTGGENELYYEESDF